MKKVVLITVLTVLGLTEVHAQKINFGAKAGLNIASITGDNTDNLDPITDFHFGIQAEISISEKFSFQPELLYSGQGSKVHLNYLNIPLMGKYYVSKGFSLEMGPQLGFLLSAKNDDTDAKDAFKSLDFGVNFGIGYKLDNGLNFSARYNLGLSDINDINGFSDKNRNGVFQLSIGYFFLK